MTTMSTTPGPAFLKIWLTVMPPPLENAAGSVLELDAPALVTVCVTVWLVGRAAPCDHQCCDAAEDGAADDRDPPAESVHGYLFTPDSSLAAYRTESARQQ